MPLTDPPIDDGHLLRRVLVAGVVVGLLDALFVIVTYVWIKDVTTPQRIFQGIATGVLGKGAFNGGVGAALLGVALHFTIAWTWVLVYVIVSRSWGGLRRFVQTGRGVAIAGPLFGVVMWLAMDFIVVPLSHARPTTPWSPTFWFFLAQHALMLGPPIVWIVR